ncbi:MAG: tetratricopeptide repeat protein, partial [Myxococcota bacterium]|nr:tetratricopeptide repeat protein [Myxococcota bacterium]
MSVDRTKILEAAQKHLAKGAYDKAIVEFQKLVKADPSDVRTWLKIGDLHAKKGSTRDAVDTYARVADQYASQGFFLKAVAVHKQILKLDPSRLDVHLKLAEAYENLQLVSDALATYEQVAGGYARAGNIDKALETLGKMVELDPESIPVRIKYAEALSKANRTKEAADAFEAGGKLLKAQGRIDDFIKVAERLLFHRTEDVAIARELSQLYLERQDAKRALAKLQICFKADPKDVPTLEMLAEAFRQLGQLPKTISVYREVARIHQEAARAEERARTLKRILELDPGDAEARQALASYAQPVAPATPARRTPLPQN